MAKFLKVFVLVFRFSLVICGKYFSRRVCVCSAQGREVGEVDRQTTSHVETGGSVSFILAAWGRDRRGEG